MVIININVPVKIQINDAVFNQVDDEWRKSFYDLKTREEIAEHVAWNLIRGWQLSNMDGFADLPDNFAKIVD